MQTKIPLATLREVTTPDGRTVLHGTLGAGGARIHIEEMAEPNEYGHTFTLQLLPPREKQASSPGRWPKQERASGAATISPSGEVVAFSSWVEGTTEGESNQL